MARTKLTDARMEGLARRIREGCFVKLACQAEGVDESTFYKWLRSEGPRYAQFRQMIEKAQGEAEADAIHEVRFAGRTDWRAAAWYLERKFPQRWAQVRKEPQAWGRPPEKIKITEPTSGDQAKPVYELDLTRLPQEALLAIVEQLENQGGQRVIDGSSRDSADDN